MKKKNKKDQVIIHALTLDTDNNNIPQEGIYGIISKRKISVRGDLYSNLSVAEKIEKLKPLHKEEYFLSNKTLVTGKDNPGSKLKVLAKDFFCKEGNPIKEVCDYEVLKELKKFCNGKKYKTMFVFERVPKPAIKRRRSAKMKAVA